MRGPTPNDGFLTLWRENHWLVIFALAGLCGWLGRNALWGVEEAAAGFVTQSLGSEWHWWNPFAYPFPPLAKMEIFAISRLTGSVSEWVLRLPSAASALLTLLMTVRIGTILFGRVAGRTAGWLLAGCAGFFFWGRMATPEMPALMWMTAAVWYYFIRGRRMRFLDWLVFALFSLLAGESVRLWTMLVPAVFVAPFLRRRDWLLMPLALCGAGVVLALPLAWDVPAIRHAAVRVGESVLHQRAATLGRVAPELFRMWLPWVLLPLAATVVVAVDFARLPLRVRRLALGCLWVLALLCLGGARKWDQLICLLPPLTILTAAMLDAAADWVIWEQSARVFRFIVIGIGSMLVVSVLLLPFWQRLFRFMPPWLFLAGLPVIGLVMLLVMSVEERNPMWLANRTGLAPDWAATLIAATVFSAGVFGWLYPAADAVRPMKSFVLQARKGLSELPPENIFYWGRNPDGRTRYYLGLPIRPLPDSGLKTRFAVLIQGRPRDYEGFLAEAENRNWPTDESTLFAQEKFWRFENKNNRKIQIRVIDPELAGEQTAWLKKK